MRRRAFCSDIVAFRVRPHLDRQANRHVSLLFRRHVRDVDELPVWEAHDAGRARIRSRLAILPLRIEASHRHARLANACVTSAKSERRETIRGTATNDIGYSNSVLQLDLGLVHGWCRATDAREYERYRATLSNDELVRCDRFHLDRDRHDYANAHDLLRRTLSRYDALPPDAWRFHATAHGKPVLAPEPCPSVPLTFNLSHTHQIVACVVSRGAAVGIDVERVDRVPDTMSIAARFFSARETATLQDRASGHDRALRFIELWTLKESFVKATGKGLSQPLQGFTFDLDDEHAISFAPPYGLTALSWRFSQYRLTRDVVGAIAACGALSWPPILRVLSGETATEVPASRMTVTGRNA